MISIDVYVKMNVLSIQCKYTLIMLKRTKKKREKMRDKNNVA